MIIETKRSLGKNYLYTQTDENLNFVGHVHNSYEFITVTDGALDCIVYDRRYKLEKGAAMLIMPNHVHRYESQEHSKSFLCIFSPDYVADFTNDTKSAGYVSSVFGFTDRGEIAALQNKSSNKYAIRAVLYGICSHAIDFLSSEPRGVDTFSLENRLIEYIRSNYDTGISLKQMSKDLGYNYCYLSDMFNKVFGCGFSKFVNRLKVEDAAELLKNADYSVAEISAYCGFNNIRTLNSRFKEVYGKTPSQYRKDTHERQRM